MSLRLLPIRHSIHETNNGHVLEKLTLRCRSEDMQLWTCIWMALLPHQGTSCTVAGVDEDKKKCKTVKAAEYPPDLYE